MSVTKITHYGHTLWAWYFSQWIDYGTLRAFDSWHLWAVHVKGAHSGTRTVI